MYAFRTKHSLRISYVDALEGNPASAFCTIPAVLSGQIAVGGLRRSLRCLRQDICYESAIVVGELPIKSAPRGRFSISIC
jgi:hypothetical protein